jgi:hypothetical protein
MTYSKFFNIRTYDAALLYVPVPKAQPRGNNGTSSVVSADEAPAPLDGPVRKTGKPSLEELILIVTAQSGPYYDESVGSL